MIRKSKTPKLHQLPKIAEDLAEKLQRDYVSIEIESCAYNSTLTDTYTTLGFRIAFQPGIDGSECSIHRFKTWQALQTYYFKIMKGEKK